MSSRHTDLPPLLPLCAWAGPAVVLIFVVGFYPLAHFFPPSSPSASAEEIAALYVNNLTNVRIGCIVMLLGSTLTIPWGLAVAAITRSFEKGIPLFTYMQVACVGIALPLAVLLPTVWGLAAFRPEAIDPNITRMLHDFGWFLYLFTWPPFAIWCLAIGLPILADKSPNPTIPRWVGYFNLWVALLEAPAALMIFFKSGPFSYNGLVTFYIPSIVYFGWIVVMTLTIIKVVKREKEIPVAPYAPA
jgi:hypothetical protein